MKTKLKIDFKRLANSALAGNLSRHLGEYEAKVREVVHDFDLKSRGAREKSRKRLDEFTAHVKKTGASIESKVSALVNQEGKRLNVKVADLITYLKAVAGSERTTSVDGAEKKKAASPRTTKASPAKKAKSGKRAAQANSGSKSASHSA